MAMAAASSPVDSPSFATTGDSSSREDACDADYHDEFKLADPAAQAPRVRHELRKLAALAMPIIVICVCDFFPAVTSIMLVGRIDSPLATEYVGSASLSSMVLLLSGESVGVGLATALDTLCSQAHGAGRSKSIGVFFQTGVVVLAVAYVPVFGFNWFTTSLLHAMNQPDQVAALAGQFSRWLLPGLPCMFLFELLKKVLQAQNIIAPLVWIAIASNLINLGLGIYLTWYTSLGFQGAAIARSASQAALPLFTLAYLRWKREHLDAWWSSWQVKEALANVPVFLKLGVPGMAMVMAESFSYNSIAILAAYLPNSVVAISVHSVLWNVANIAFRFFMGVAIATNVMVGNYVGSGHRRHAHTASNLGMLVVLALAMVLVVIILAGRHGLSTVFISDPDAVELASEAMLFLIPFALFDAVNCVMQGIFRGTGQQTFAAIVNMVCLFVVGMPCRYVFAFPLDMGVEGFWLGLVVGYACCVAVSYVKIWRTDWSDMVTEAKLRTDV